jgi:hypothetical protein
MFRFRAAIPILLLPMGTAWAAPTIAITAPTPNQPLHNVTPLITVTYSAPAPGLDLATLQVLVNGADWTARFTKTAASASYQVTTADAFVAGTLTLSASIRDNSGAQATATQTYAVHPTLVSVSPERGTTGTVLTIGALGLDVDASHNVLLFAPVQAGPALRVPFTTVDRAAGTGTATVPAQTRTGEVLLEVNGRVSQAGKLFVVQGTYATCGLPWDVRYLADGDLLAFYTWYYGATFAGSDWLLADPQCVFYPYGQRRRTVLARLGPDGGMVALKDLWSDHGTDNGAILGIATHKDGQGYAYMWRHKMLALPVYYRITTSAGVTVGFVELAPFAWEYAENALDTYYPIPLDFDVAGNLYFAAYNVLEWETARLRLYRISAAQLATGGSVEPEVVKEFPEYVPRSPTLTGLMSLQVQCDGTVYMALLRRTGTAQFSWQWIVRRTSVTNSVDDVEWPLSVPATFSGSLRLLPSCRGNELLAVLERSLPSGKPDLEGYVVTHGNLEPLGSISQTQSGNTLGAPPEHFTAPGAVSPAGELTVAPWWGFVNVGMGAAGCGPSPNTWPCPPLKVLSATSRWSPTRRTTPLEIHFSSPYALSSATLEVRDPAGALVSATTGALVETGPQTYRLDWTLPNPAPGEGDALAPGHYRLVVSGTRTDGLGVATSHERVVSLVEVSEVRLEALPDAPPLDDNPAVPPVEGQDPGLGRPGGGKRIFAESTTPAGPVHNRVKVVVVTTPLLTPDPSQPPQASTVRVHLRAFDVDDPAPYLPDKDGDTTADAVDDNRGAPVNGALADAWLDIPAGSATASTEFTVSSQPGDNYRIAASTGAEWLASVRARQNLTPGPPVQDGALTVNGSTVSPMLTVWRSLNMEIDSMAPPPVETTPPGAPEYAQRNFIQGRLLRIEVQPSPDLPGLFNQVFYVETEATTPPLRLADGSTHWPNAAGRFQNGRLTFGVGAEAFVASVLTGNGDDASGEYVLGSLFGGSVPPQYSIPYQAIQGTLRERAGTVIWWNTATRVFTLSPALPGAFVGGTLRVAGQDWPIVAVSGGDVTVGGTQEIPAHLVDDDAAEHPFAVSTALLQPVADPTQNPFAQAYVIPRLWTPPGATLTAPFTRNVCGDCQPSSLDELQAVVAALTAGRDSPASTPAFWIAYVQGAFQLSTRRDDDPNAESAALGMAPGLCDASGAMILTESLRDAIANGGLTGCVNYDSKTSAHEVGHQFGLTHECGGIMAQGCGAPRFFTARALAGIRARVGATQCDPEPICP